MSIPLVDADLLSDSFRKKKKKKKNCNKSDF